jgi:hypothetical protein
MPVNGYLKTIAGQREAIEAALGSGQYGKAMGLLENASDQIAKDRIARLSERACRERARRNRKRSVLLTVVAVVAVVAFVAAYIEALAGVSEARQRKRTAQINAVQARGSRPQRRCMGHRGARRRPPGFP